MKDDDIYELVLATDLSRKINDASLCIREIYLAQEAGHPEDRSSNDERIFEEVALHTTKFLIGLTKATGLKLRKNIAHNSKGFYSQQDIPNQRIVVGNRDFSRLIYRFLKNLNLAFKCRIGSTRFLTWKPCHEAFINLAVDLEALLGVLARHRSREDNLIEEMSGLRL